MSNFFWKAQLNFAKMYSVHICRITNVSNTENCEKQLDHVLRVEAVVVRESTS